ncbi:MAG: DUF2059 domain-containing protein [Candidatus Latescibacteria bacterium]|nr:DUF2059 domain-containing protein [Candidatus Latescibacterota bacterium]
MKRIILFIALGVGIIAGSACAQDTSQLALAEKLLNSMKIQDTIEQSFAAAKQMLPAQMQKMQHQMGKSDSDPEALVKSEKMMDMISQELSWEKLKDQYIALYADVFTEAELKGLLAFYESPIGQKFVNKQPELTKRSMILTNRIMLKVVPKMQKMIKEQMKAAKPAKPKESAK